MNPYEPSSPLPDRLAFGFLIILAAMVFSACHQSRMSEPGGPDGGGAITSDAAVSTDSSTGSLGWQACETSFECTVLPRTCCGRCGLPTAEDMVGVNRDRVSEYREYQDCSSDDLMCPECAGRSNPHLLAYCTNRRYCDTVDLEGGEFSQGCERDSDCVLTTPTCCGGCGTLDREQVISIRAEEESRLREFLECPEDLACPPCVGETDPTIRAACDMGVCVIGAGSGGAPPSSDG